MARAWHQEAVSPRGAEADGATVCEYDDESASGADEGGDFAGGSDVEFGYLGGREEEGGAV